MKILYHHRIRSKDGQYVHIEELTNAFRQLGHDIVFVGPAAVEKQEFGSDAGMITILKRALPRFVYELLEFGYAFLAYVRLWRAVRRHCPDCLYERYNLFLPAGVWIKRPFKLPMLLEVNAPLLDERSKHGGIALIPLARWSEQYTWRGADFVLPVTHVLAERIRRAKVPDSRIVVIPNGVDPARFSKAPARSDAKRALGLTGRLVLGFTGFVREWHGLERVIDWMAESSSQLRCHLLLVGDGPVRRSLERQAREKGVENQVTITGVVGRDRIADYVSAFDVALQPDVVPYASPLKLFEYMVLGCAIVAPATANIQEILTDGENAVLFDPKDSRGLQTAVERVCRDPSLRERICQGAKRTLVDKGLTWENNARRVVDLVLQLRRKDISASVSFSPSSGEGAGRIGSNTPP